MPSPVETALGFLPVNSLVQKFLGFVDRFGDGSSLAPMHAVIDTTGERIDPAKSQDITGLIAAIQGILQVRVAAIAFVDRSGTTSMTQGAFTQLAAANTSRQYLRINNQSTTATLYVWDKTGLASIAGSMSIGPGAGYVFDAKVSSTAIQVAGSDISAPYEAAEG